jgi:serine/threonine protein kinase
MESRTCKNKKSLRSQVNAQIIVPIHIFRVMSRKSVQSVMNERLLLTNLHSTFIVNMQYAFQDRDTLYLVLDLLEGGDLRHHINLRRFS